MKMNKNQVALRNEIESKLNQAEMTYNERSYCISLATEKETLAKMNKIKALGYEIVKNSNNHFTILG